MIGLDTNVLVRYFTQDDARQSALATHFVESQLHSERPGHVCLVSLAELAWVLRTRYDASKELVVDILERLLSDRRFVIQAADAVWAALDAYRGLAIDFGDALIAALDRLQGCSHTVTFDRGSTRIDGMLLLEPAR